MTEIISGENLNQNAIDIIVKAVDELLQIQPQAVLAIPGGRSVQGIFKLLAQEKRIPWEVVQIFMVDERLVPLTDGQSNFKLAKELFIDSLINQNLLPKANVHPFIFNPKTPDKGISEYQKALKRFGGKYDIIILGVGEDGHVGALFPNHSITDESEYYLTMTDSSKPPPERMTASRQLLVKSKYALALFLGEAKRQALANYKDENLTIEECPAKIIDEIKNSYLITDLK